MSSTLKDDETGEPFHVQQRKQIEVFREAWSEAGHEREPRVSVSRSHLRRSPTTWTGCTSAATATSSDQIGQIDGQPARDLRPILRRRARRAGQAARRGRGDRQAADTLLLTVPNQLGVDYNAHVLETILTHVAPAPRLALTPHPPHARN